jgi:hypothetical protein
VSISLLLAVTMMIGTLVLVRSSRHTSIPDLSGNQMSSSTRSGRTRSNIARPSMPSRATVTRKPSRLRPDHQRLDEGLLVLDHQHSEGFRHDALLLSIGERVSVKAVAAVRPSQGRRALRGRWGSRGSERRAGKQAAK